MRLLLATNHLLRPGGTERWTETMFRHLSRQGHRVDVLAMTENKLFRAPAYSPREHYDLGIINHHTCLRYVLQQGNVARAVFTSHGVIPDLERAIPGADWYVGVSEETSEAIPFPSAVIRNPIDTDVFQPAPPVRDKLRRILFLSTHQGPALPIVTEAARGYQLEIIGRGPSVTHDVAGAINQADLVIALGRSALEAMACNRNVIVFDYKGGDGFVTEENVRELARRNFSGRTHRKWYSAEELRAEIERYDPAIQLRDYVLREHEAGMIAGRYLDLANSSPAGPAPWPTERDAGTTLPRARCGAPT